ncbi:MAG: N-acetylglucosamine-6-phosphate deacetylase [Lachnospiraceae bacterium]|nr:N-acetylglucosamine-6-phosphate deacetylase [Lachnospiraceae bacterium]
MRIKNVKVYTEERTFQEGEIFIEGGRFVRGEEKQGEILDGEGCWAIPGLIDIHFHGCMGYDFCDGSWEALETIANYQASVGVTAMAPATMALSVEELERILAVAADYRRKEGGGADLLGVNMEGPFISKAKKGAQNEAHIIPASLEVFHRFQRAARGLVKYIAIAPEEPGALTFVRQATGEAVVSLAHTNADYDTAKAAFDQGASHVVHLFNGMSAFTHRSPGVVGAAADSAHVTAELICDGVHVHPSAVRAVFKIFGSDRIILISDSMRATGMPDGEYMLGGQTVEVTGERATLAGDGALAGSVTNLMDCMRIAVKKMGIPLEEAVACAAANPAKSLGEYEQYGSISPGKKANLVLLDSSLEVKAVIKDGKIIRNRLMAGWFSHR